MAEEITSNSSSVKFDLASQDSATPHSTSGGSSASFAPKEQTVISRGTPFSPPPEAFPLPRQSEIGRSLEGQQLAQFRLEEFVGGGGMGAVIRGYDTTLDRIVAIKVVSNDRTDEDTLRRFRNEATSAARLDHPNIAKVYSVGDEDGWSFIVFEFIEGVNIRDLVVHKGPLPIDEAISYVIQAADALQHASERDIVHRDIKPSNLLVMEDGRAKLVDMGLARLRQVGGADDITETGVTLGTFDYISPEQAREPRKADVRSDLYSLGCTFYYMLTGMPPFPEGTAMQKLLSHSGATPPDPRDLRGDIPEELTAICLKLMAKDPGHRYQEPNDLIDALTSACEVLGLITPQTTRVPRAEDAAHFDRLIRHLPWAVPLVLLFAVVFGVDGLLPQAEPLPSNLLEPNLTESPVVAEVGTNREVEASSDSAGATGDGGADPVPEATMVDPVSPPGEEPGSPEPLVGTESEAATLTELRPIEETQASLGVEPIGAVLDLAPDTLAMLSHQDGFASPEPDMSEPAEVGTGPDPLAYDTTRLIVMPDAPPSPSPHPMMVSSLEEAIAMSRLPGFAEATTIELRFDRHRSRPIEIRRDLMIEAAEGYKPIVIFDAKPAGDKRMVNLQGGTLTVRGIHFELNVPDVLEGGWALFHLDEVEAITLTDASLTIRNDYRTDASFFQVQGPRMIESAEDAEVTPVATLPFITLEQVIARGQATLVRATEGLPFHLTYTDGFLVTTERLVELAQLAKGSTLRGARIELQHVTAMMNEGMCRVQMSGDKSRLPQVRIISHKCLLRHLSMSPLIEHVGVEGLDEVRNMTGLRLSGDENGYPGSKILWRLLPRIGDSLNIQWVDTDAGWFEQGYNLSAQWANDPPDETKRPYEVIPAEYAVRGDYIGFSPELAEILPELEPETATSEVDATD